MTREIDSTADGASLDAKTSETILVRFLGGQEQTAEMMVRLALQTGHSLVDVYDQIRMGIAEAAASSDAHLLLENELDESLVRLVARLRRPIVSRPVWKACLLSTEGRGVSACISHLTGEAGMASITVAALTGGGSEMSGAATLARLLPTVEYVIIDASRVRSETINRYLRLIEHLDFAASRTQVVLLADAVRSQDPGRYGVIPGLVVVEDLSSLLTALGLAPSNPLTAREREVLRQVASGATNELVAHRLGLAVSTVKTYLERIHVKLKSRDRASAVATAMLRDWL